LRLKLVLLGKVTEIGCSRLAVICEPGPAEDEAGTDLFGISGFKIQPKIGAQG
jgi:hypothetical protein